MEQEQVVLVDPNDAVLGTMEKLEAHKKGVLHRAFSVFIFNATSELLLQRRAAHKYHSPSLWTNTCCSHPGLYESNIDAGQRRLKEEMGFETTLLEHTRFIYKTHLNNDLIEHELDTILIGRFEGIPSINPDEVADWKWMPLEAVREDVAKKPFEYTAWFKIIFEKYDTFTYMDDES